MMEGVMEASHIPRELVQIVLGYCDDTHSLAAARLVCRAWREGAAEAPSRVSLTLRNSKQDVRQQLASVLKVLPSLQQATLRLPRSEAPYLERVARSLAAWRHLTTLTLHFLESKELEEATLSPLTSLTSLTTLTLVNITVTEAAHLAPLAQLPGLTSLDLIQHNKVAAMLSGDACLDQLSQLTQLTRLVLKGRISGLGNPGLLALKQLTALTHLSISWVPGQTPVTQAAALQLLGSLRHLQHLSLGGAELLTSSSTPSTTSAPARAAAAAAAQVASAAQAAVAGVRSSRNSWASRLEAAAAAAAAARTAGAAVLGGGGGQGGGGGGGSGAGHSALLSARSLGAPLTAASSRASADGADDTNSHSLTGQTGALRAPPGTRVADKHNKLRGSRSGDWEDIAAADDTDEGRAARRQRRRAAAAAAVAAARAAAAAAAARAAAAAAEAMDRTTAALAAVEKRREVSPLTLAELVRQLGSFQLAFTSAGSDMAGALTDLGPLRDRVTGLAWSYAKLGPLAPTSSNPVASSTHGGSSSSSSSSSSRLGPSRSIGAGPSYTSMLLLAQCSLLRKIKINLWFQDGGSRARHQLDLSDLAPLKHLEVLVVDKRPPFQQQLPTQQTSIKVPVDSKLLTTAAASWPRLRRLGLGLARDDYVAEDLHLLVKLVNLQKLRLASYDLGDGDAAYMLPLPVTALPADLQQLDLFHVVLQSPPEGAAGGYQQHPHHKQQRAGPGSSPHLLVTAATADCTRYTATGTAAAAAAAGGARHVRVEAPGVTSSTHRVTPVPRTMSAMPATATNHNSSSSNTAAGAAQRAADTRARAAAYQNAERARVAAVAAGPDPMGAPASIAEDSSSSALRSQRSFNVAALTAAAVRSAAQQYDAPVLSMAASVNLVNPVNQAGGATGSTSPFVMAASAATAAGGSTQPLPQVATSAAAGGAAAACGSSSTTPTPRPSSVVSPLAAAYLRADQAPGSISTAGAAGTPSAPLAPLASSSSSSSSSAAAAAAAAAAIGAAPGMLAAAPRRPSPFGMAGGMGMPAAAASGILAAYGSMGGAASSSSGGGARSPNPFAAAAAAAAAGPASILGQVGAPADMAATTPLPPHNTATTSSSSSSSGISAGGARPSPFLSAFAAGGSSTAAAAASAALAPSPEAATTSSSSSAGTGSVPTQLSGTGVKTPAPFGAAAGMAAAAAALGVRISGGGGPGGGVEGNPLAAMEALVAQSAAAAAAEHGQQQEDTPATPCTAAAGDAAAAGPPPLAPKLSFWGSVKKSLVPQGSVRRLMGLAPRDSHRPSLTGDKAVDQKLLGAPSITKRLTSWGSISKAKAEPGSSSSSSSKAAIRASYDGAGAGGSAATGSSGRTRNRVTHDGSSVRAVITPRPTGAAAGGHKLMTSWAPAGPLTAQTSAPMPKPRAHATHGQQQAAARVSAGGGRLLSMGSLQLPGKSSTLGGTMAGSRAQLSTGQFKNGEQESDAGQLPCLQRLQLRHCELQAGASLSELVSCPRLLTQLTLHEVTGLTPSDVALLPLLVHLRDLSLISPRSDVWLGLGPLKLLTKLKGLRHLEWVPSDKALPGRARMAAALQPLLQFTRLNVVTLPVALAKYDQLVEVSEKMPAGVTLKMLTPCYCEHSQPVKPSRLTRLFSGLLPSALLAAN